MVETRITKEVDYSTFRELIDRFKNRVKINSHTYFRLDEMQRKVYKDEVLINILTEEKPVFIGIQKNENYAVFFSKKQGFLRIMFKETKENIEIITFYFVDKIPKI